MLLAAIFLTGFGLAAPQALAHAQLRASRELQRVISAAQLRLAAPKGLRQRIGAALPVPARCAPRAHVPG